jgi:hypothetical protein
MKELSLLPLLNAALVTDLIVISLFLLGVLPSVSLGRWYKSFHLGAVIMDVLVLALVVLLAHYLYPYVFGPIYSIWKFGLLAVGIQLVHDLLALGARDFGENRDQEAGPKAKQIAAESSERFNWHFIGQLQTNKVKSVLEYADFLHSLDRP